MQPADRQPETTDWTPGVAALWFWSVAGFFAVLWVLLPTLFQPGYRPDVVELQIIGREWVLASRKHPMLPAWMLEILNILTNRCFAAPFIASQLCVLVTLWSIWSLGRRVVSERLALVGCFVMLPYWFFTIESVKYNQNIVLIACCTLSVYLVFRAFQTDRPAFWIGAGVAIGLAFHAKYTAILLVAGILLYMILRPEQRAYWKRPGPYLTTLVALLVFLPHIIWLFRNDFATLYYAQSRKDVEIGWLYHLYNPVRFAVSNAGHWALCLLCLLPSLRFPWTRTIREPGTPRVCEQYLFYCIATPFVMHLLIALVTATELNNDYGAAFWPFLGLYLLLRYQTKDTKPAWKGTVACVVASELLLVAGFFVQSVLSPYWSGDARRFHFPMQALAERCDRIWDERFDVPCPYVSGEWFCAGNAALAMRDRPSVLFYWAGLNDPEALPAGTWADDMDVNRRGGIIVWQIKPKKKDGEIAVREPPFLRMRFPTAEVLPEVLELPYKTGAPIPPLRIGVAVVPPPGA